YFDQKTTTNPIKTKKYLTYDELVVIEARKENYIFYRILKRIRKTLHIISTSIMVFLKWIGFIRLLVWIKKGLSWVFSKTQKISLLLFKSKKDGILAYSDYKKPSRRFGYYVTYLFIFVGLLIILIPFIWLFLTSFKNANELLVLPDQYVFFPTSMNFTKYVDVIEST